MKERVRLEELLLSADELLRLTRWDHVRTTLSAALRVARGMRDFVRMYSVARRVPLEVQRLGDWVGFILQLACHARDAFGALDLLESLPTAERAHWIAFEVWALRHAGRLEEALWLADSAPTEVEHRGLLLRTRAECLAALNRPGWLDGFAGAKAFLSGRSLGICLLEEGSQRLLKADFVGAQRAYSESYALLRTDPYFGAWLKYNLGILCLQQVSEEAELHFLEMQRLTRSDDAAGFRARAWCGLGAARRVLGEWSRAEAAYRAGLACATEADDRFEAQRGLGYTLRLAGRSAEALEVLYGAALLGGEREPSEQVDLAATLLLRGDEIAALEVLQRAQQRLTRPQHVERAHIVRAELYRREGRTDAALAELAAVAPDALWTREEQRCFPALFALAKAMDLQVVALPQRDQTVVQVRARGVLSVTVNGRSVPVRSVSRAGELLVLLLEGGGEVSVEGLVAALYPNHEGKAGKNALSKQVTALKKALGWAHSVAAVGGAYRLDSAARWSYDVGEARERGEHTQRFMEGVYSDWAVELARNLAGDHLRALN